MPLDSTPTVRKLEIEKEGKNNMGFIAQEVKKVFPSLVQYDEEIQKYMVDYTGLIPVLVKAIQEQQSKIEELESEINLLKKP